MKMVEKGMKIVKKNVAKFLLLSSLLGGMAIAHPVSANTKAAIYEYKNGQLDLVQAQVVHLQVPQVRLRHRAKATQVTHLVRHQVQATRSSDAYCQKQVKKQVSFWQHWVCSHLQGLLLSPFARNFKISI